MKEDDDDSQANQAAPKPQQVPLLNDDAAPDIIQGYLNRARSTTNWALLAGAAGYASLAIDANNGGGAATVSFLGTNLDKPAFAIALFVLILSSAVTVAIAFARLSILVRHVAEKCRDDDQRVSAWTALAYHPWVANPASGYRLLAGVPSVAADLLAPSLALFATQWAFIAFLTAKCIEWAYDEFKDPQTTMVQVYICVWGAVVLLSWAARRLAFPDWKAVGRRSVAKFMVAMALAGGAPAWAVFQVLAVIERSLPASSEPDRSLLEEALSALQTAVATWPW